MLTDQNGSYFSGRKTTEFAAKLAVARTMIFLLVNPLLTDVPFRIWTLIVPIFFGLLFLWIIITGK
jgi:hypothetical protein